MPRRRAKVRTAQGSFSSGLAQGQPRYDENKQHTERTPALIGATAEQLLEFGVDVVFVNGLERVSTNEIEGRHVGRAGVDQLTAFAAAFGDTDTYAYLPTVYLGLDQKDRVGADNQWELQRRGDRAAFGNAMFFRKGVFDELGGLSAFLPVLGQYNRFDSHEPRGLVVREMLHRASGERMRFAITELADRNPEKDTDPPGMRNVENSLQLMTVLEAIRTGGRSLIGNSPIPDLDKGGDPNTLTVLAGSLNRPPESVLPTRAEAEALIKDHRLVLTHHGDIVHPVIGAAIDLLPETPTTLQEFLDSNNIIAMESGVTGEQQFDRARQLDYTTTWTPEDAGVEAEAELVAQEQLAVGYRKFTITDINTQPLELV